MNRADVKEVLREAFGPNVYMSDMEGWVSICCPLSKWTHVHGAEKTASAGVSVHDRGISVFNCFTCTKPMPVSGMLRRYEQLSGRDLGNLADSTDSDEFFGGTIPEWDELGTEVAETPPEPLDAALYLDLYDSAAGHPYLRKRGITNKTAEAIGLLVDPSDSEGEERILFPVYNPDGGFYGFSGRAVKDSARLKVRDYHGLPKRFTLLGAHRIDPMIHKYVIAVEGLFDYARLAQYGFPVVAYMTAKPTVYQQRILRDIGLPTYLMSDNPMVDRAGAVAMDSVAKSLSIYLPVLCTAYPEAYVVMKDGTERLVKDPDELTRDEVMYMIENAELVCAG